MVNAKEGKQRAKGAWPATLIHATGVINQQLRSRVRPMTPWQRWWSKMGDAMGRGDEPATEILGVTNDCMVALGKWRGDGGTGYKASARA
jgi:hypothetical protein